MTSKTLSKKAMDAQPIEAHRLWVRDPRINKKTFKEKKDIFAQLTEACRLWDEGDLQQAFRIFTKLARAGDMSAQLGLAHFYGDGLWVKKNPQKELYWLYKLVDKKDSTAASYLGAIYRMQKKYAQAIAWFALAGHGEYGDGGSFYEAGGRILLEKLGDVECARQYLLLAEKSYKSALICEYDLEKTEELLKKIQSSEKHRVAKASLAKEAADALFLEACRHRDEDNWQAAFRLFMKLSKAGDERSQLNLANFYGEGLGVKKDVQQKMYWLYRAADQGSVPAASNLGVIYRRQKKYAQAIAWLALAGYGEYGGAFCDIGEILLEKFDDKKCAKQYLLLAKRSTWMCEHSMEKTEELLKAIRSSRKPAVQEKATH